jgi:3-phenylpropionate/trans-cinnamate dioxygenase ferredoxin subunit
MSWVRVADLEELVPGSARRFDIGDHRVAVFRVEGDVYAIGDRCSHAEASLSEGDLEDLEVECPLHGALFDISTGEARSLPATRPVPSYRADVRDGAVFLQLEAT